MGGLKKNRRDALPLGNSMGGATTSQVQNSFQKLERVLECLKMSERVVGPVGTISADHLKNSMLRFT